MNALDSAASRTFVLAGKAVFTLVSKTTGKRFTYKVTRSKDCSSPDRPSVWFVKVLAGPDNSNDFRYVGFVRLDQFVWGAAKSFAAKDAPSVVAFEWFVRRVLFAEQPASDRVEVFHEGRCGRCGRALTIPESVASGLGPECAGRAA